MRGEGSPGIWILHRFVKVPETLLPLLLEHIATSFFFLDFATILSEPGLLDPSGPVGNILVRWLLGALTVIIKYLAMGYRRDLPPE